MPIVDCVYERGQFFLPLALNGSAPHHFIFDTGAGISAVDAALAVELGLPLPIVVVDSGGYDEIRTQQQARGIDRRERHGQHQLGVVTPAVTLVCLRPGEVEHELAPGMRLAVHRT